MTDSKEAQFAFTSENAPIIHVHGRQWLIPSESNPGMWHLVTLLGWGAGEDGLPTEKWECSCPAGRHDQLCKHVKKTQAARFVGVPRATRKPTPR